MVVLYIITKYIFYTAYYSNEHIVLVYDRVLKKTFFSELEAPNLPYKL